MNCGFQTDAFQNDAFQVCVPAVSVGADSFVGSSELDERMWRRLEPREEEPQRDDLAVLLAAYMEYYN